jgi:beta-carotene ketolase (CrtW type)
LFFLLQWKVDYTSIWNYLAIALQTHLYTGLFITAHDAMHGTVSKSRGVNTFFGRLTAILFAFNLYDKLIDKHYMHHRNVASDDDPDW